ncbi:hypothetical protein BSZ37_05300 [Rubrivirga marina]|uniref:Uncharacterized protein n=1 Tax=Rubrivirga marina TaxID=1196024 RepID=A0A271IXD2_9BACT|nr:hypothetical protein BSZ37_05300 [Rubrivirga marina]
MAPRPTISGRTRPTTPSMLHLALGLLAVTIAALAARWHEADSRRWARTPGGQRAGSQRPAGARERAARGGVVADRVPIATVTSRASRR